MKRALILLALALCLLPAARAAAAPNIAAAADLKFALTEVAAAYAHAGGGQVSLSFGSSGIFRRQIAQGAPFDLYLSADEAYVDALIAEISSQLIVSVASKIASMRSQLKFSAMSDKDGLIVGRAA